MSTNFTKPKTFQTFDRHDWSICMAQGRLFYLAGKLNFDPKDFTEKYMNSQFCNNHIDSPYDNYHKQNTECIMTALLKEITPSKANEPCYPYSMEYIGYVYQYIHIRSGVPSSKIYQRLPYDKIKNICLMSINQDEEETLYYIMEKYKKNFPEIIMDE